MSDKLKINFQNCYGIGKLETELEFKHKGYAIYAPNGVMKTSFAKTMMDISQGAEPSDLVFPERESVFDLSLNGSSVAQDEIFVVQSYDENYFSEEVSTLLANTDLKEKYEKVHKDIAAAKKDLDKKLLEYAGYGSRSRENVDAIIERIYGDKYYDVLLELEGCITGLNEAIYSKADYKILFDPKVQKLLKDKSVEGLVNDFTKKYQELTEQSPVLRAEFQYHNITQVQGQLEANNFFGAGHSINLKDKNTDSHEEFVSNEEFAQKIESEKLRVLSDQDLQKKFDSFNSKLKNKELVAFRDYITENQHLLPELKDLETFERNLWTQYLVRAKSEVLSLLEQYKKGQEDLTKIVKEAQENPSDWDEVIAEFNRRFVHLPFKLSVGNKTDVILKGQAPAVEFDFVDGDKERTFEPTQKSDLLRVLSTGEARALYILNIMFEIHSRWKQRKKTLFVFDDVADSFDYKNKFAIINYLEDVVKVEGVDFLSIILTHNFDFLRTIESRRIAPAHQCRMAFKTNGVVTLGEFKMSDIQNPFHKWQYRLDERVVQIAYIPFLRNLIEYTQGTRDNNGNENPDYMTLTKMVHYKDDTEGLTLLEYKDVFDRFFPNVDFPDIDLTVQILDQIFDAADECAVQNDGINLEHKIVLSIAIRVLAERFIVLKIRENEPSYETIKKQTGQLVQDYVNRFNNEKDIINLLRRVSLITPSNIHINSFMYEPILDMGFGELVALYEETKETLS